MKRLHPLSPEASSTEEHVAAYERARAERGPTDLSSFAPGPESPLRVPVLRELVCVELELARDDPDRPSLDAYRARFPELFRDRPSVLAIARQEYQVRREAGENVNPEEYARRYGLVTSGWEAPEAAPVSSRTGWSVRLLRAAELYEDHRRDVAASSGRAERSGPGAHQPPDGGGPSVRDRVPRGGGAVDHLTEGDEVLGFRLLREMGRGTFGRVFLAEQHGLAARPVALKLGEDLIDESRALAQLQHTHIVPIHSVHRDGPLQAVCMPYFGSTTLAHVITFMRRSGGPPARGNAVWAVLQEQATTGSPPSSSGLGPSALALLRRMDHVRACLWVVSRLADALSHAHERGVLHRDIKPANVLVADDGQPMLLDFNLASHSPSRADAPLLFGGTLPYMSPEQLREFLGRAAVIDARSDIYSLGLVLHELLTGRPAFPIGRGVAREQVEQMLRDRSSGVPRPQCEGGPRLTPAVESILRRCLQPDPVQRYASARQLVEDLGRQLDDRPLLHAADPSPRERFGKWSRRHRRRSGWVAVAVLAASLLGLTASYQVQARRAAQAEASAALVRFAREYRDAEVLLSLPSPEPEELAEGERLCREALGRFGLPDGAGRHAPPAHVRDDCVDLLLLLARPVALRATRETDPSLRRSGLDEALRLNALAGALDDDHRTSESVRLWQRSRLLRLAGSDSEADLLAESAERLAAGSHGELLLMGTEEASQGRPREAVLSFRAATRAAPDRVAPWTALGACHSTLGEHERAASCFDVAVALQPDAWRPRLWRAQARLQLKDHAQARADLDTVLALREDLAPALFLRGLARFGEGDHVGAEGDLTRALTLDPGHTRLYFARRRVRLAAGDLDGAARDLREGTQREPGDELSRLSRADARREDEPLAALADYDQVLAANPASIDAAMNKAYVLSEKLGRTDEAITALDHLLTRHPRHAPALAGRGVLLARQGKRDRALIDAREALEADPGAMVRYQVAGIHAQTSREMAPDRVEAYRLLKLALKGGVGADLIGRDPDLAPLHGDPEFRRLLALASVLLSVE
jgi:serine/threonine protein kinase/Tfp pilus assembly protein PilF